MFTYLVLFQDKFHEVLDRQNILESKLDRLLKLFSAESTNACFDNENERDLLVIQNPTILLADCVLFALILPRVFIVWVTMCFVIFFRFLDV